MESKRLDNAALAAGISPNYINAHGKPQSISAETKRRLLDAMHQRTATKVAVTPVPNVMVYTSGKKMPMVVEGSGEYSWLLTTEEGKQYKGHVMGGKAFNLPTKLPEGYHTLTLTQDDQRAHCRVIVAPKRCYEPRRRKAVQRPCDGGQSVQSTDEAAGRLSHADAYPGRPARALPGDCRPETLLRTAGVAE